MYVTTQKCCECDAPATSCYSLALGTDVNDYGHGGLSSPNTQAMRPPQYYCIRHSPWTREAYELGLSEGRRAVAIQGGKDHE